MENINTPDMALAYAIFLKSPKPAMMPNWVVLRARMMTMKPKNLKGMTSEGALRKSDNGWAKMKSSRAMMQLVTAVILMDA